MSAMWEVWRGEVPNQCFLKTCEYKASLLSRFRLHTVTQPKSRFGHRSACVPGTILGFHSDSRVPVRH